MKRPLTLILAISTVLISISSVILFYKSGIGVNALILVTIFLLIMLFLAQYTNRLSKSFLIHSFVIWTLAIPLAITTSVPIQLLICAFIVYEAVLLFFSYVGETWRFGLVRYFVSPLEIGAMALLGAIFPLAKIGKIKLKTPVYILRIFLGILLSIPFLALFTVLLISGDLAFREFVTGAFSENFFADTFLIFIWVLSVAWAVLGSLYYVIVLKPREQLKKVSAVQTYKPSSRFLIEGATILVLMEILFLVFNIVQAAYLFGGESLILEGDFTYSEYARKGFFELVAVSILAFLLVGGILKLKRTATSLQSNIMRLIGVCGILELIPMTASAFYRLYMYENAYGFTRLRMFSHAFICLLMLLSLWFLIKLIINVREKIFLYGILMLASISVIAIGFFNTDALITSLNISRYDNTTGDEKELDLGYLHTLSYDAVPPLIKLYKRSDNPLKEEIAFYLKSFYARIVYDDNKSAFRSYLDRQSRAIELLEELLPEINHDAAKYEQKVIENRSLDGRDAGYYESYYSCERQGRKFMFIDTNGENLYFEAARIMKLDNTSYEVTEVDTFECLEVDPGTYMIVVVKDHYLGSQEVQIVTIDDSNSEVILVSRDVVYEAM